MWNTDGKQKGTLFLQQHVKERKDASKVAFEIFRKFSFAPRLLAEKCLLIRGTLVFFNFKIDDDPTSIALQWNHHQVSLTYYVVVVSQTSCSRFPVHSEFSEFEKTWALNSEIPKRFIPKMATPCGQYSKAWFLSNCARRRAIVALEIEVPPTKQGGQEGNGKVK